MSSPWLFGRRADLLLFGGSTALALLFLGIGHATGLLDGDAPPWLFLVAVVGVDVAHVWATGWRVLADGERRARAPRALPGRAARRVGRGRRRRIPSRLSSSGGSSRISRSSTSCGSSTAGSLSTAGRTEKDEDGRLLDAAAIYGATLTPLLFWHAHLPRRFQWFLRGDFVNGLPEGVSRVAFVLYAGIFAAWVVKEVARARAGRPVSWGKVLIVLSTAVDVVPRASSSSTRTTRSR